MEARIDVFMASDTCVPLPTGRYSTPEMIDLEREAVHIATATLLLGHRPGLDQVADDLHHEERVAGRVCPQRVGQPDACAVALAARWGRGTEPGQEAAELGLRAPVEGVEGAAEVPDQVRQRLDPRQVGDGELLVAAPVDDGDARVEGL